MSHSYILIICFLLVKKMRMFANKNYLNIANHIFWNILQRISFQH